MAVTTFLILMVGCVVIAHATHLRGKFGKQEFDIGVRFGDDEMTVTMHTMHNDVNTPDNFRDTTNLHIFSRRLLIQKNTVDRHCYVRYFVESEDQMKGRVENALYNNGTMGNMMEELLILDFPSLTNRTVNVLLGPKVASFCIDHDVYAIADEDVVLLEPEGSIPMGRVRRSASPVEKTVSGVCCCCCRCCPPSQ